MSIYEDGTYTTPVQNGTRRIRFPFITATAQDKYARIHERDFVVQSPLYIPVTTDRASVTNLILQSETFDNASWTKTSTTVSANSVANPMDGLVTADSLLEVAASAEHTITQAGTIAASAATLSVAVSAKGRDWVLLKITDSAAAAVSAFFNLSTGAVGTVSAGATASISMIVPGWYRCALTYTSPASGSATCSIQPSTDGTTISYLGVATSGLYLFGAQLEQASSANQYALTTSVTRGISAPPTDYTQNGASDPYADQYAFLLGELIPEVWGGNAPYFQFTRPYARIPATQVTYPGSRYFPLPAFVNDYAGLTSIPAYTYPYSNTNYGDGFYNQTAAAIYTTPNQALYGPVIELGVRTVGYATAGTFTLTYGADTTSALNYNDSAATIQTALNGLASVIAAGLTAVIVNNLASTGGGNISVTFSAGRTFTPVTLNGGSLTVTTSNHPTTQISDNATQVIRLADQYVATSHGFNTSNDLACVNNIAGDSILIVATGNWGSINSNTIWVPAADLSTDTVIAAGSYSRSYVSGRIYLLRTRLTEDFFLPGVSPGITTASDIPVSAGLQNPADFIGALLSLTGWQTYETEGPAFWMNGPIYRRGYTAINLDDIST